MDGDFTAEVAVDGDFSALYDQAGLMVRASAERWIKAGAEYNDGALSFSTVLTNDLSDWSLGSRADTNRFRLRMTIAQGVLKVQCSADERNWTLMRLAPFAPGDATRAGSSGRCAARPSAAVSTCASQTSGSARPS